MIFGHSCIRPIEPYALREASVAAGVSWPAPTDATIVPGGTTIRTAHILELHEA